MLWILPVLTVQSHLNGSLPSGVMLHFPKNLARRGRGQIQMHRNRTKTDRTDFPRPLKDLTPHFPAKIYFKK